MQSKQQAHILALYQMMLADDEVNILELQTLNRIATEKFGLGQKEITSALLSENNAVYIPETPKEKIEFLYNMALMAWADGIIAPEEKRLLKNYILKFDFEESDSEEIMNFLLSEAHDAQSKGNTFDKVWEKITNN